MSLYARYQPIALGGGGGSSTNVIIGTYDLQVGSANGLTVVGGNTLYAQSATASVPGMVNTGAQTFGGIKNFSSNIFAANLSGTNSGDVTLGTANGLSLSGQALSLAQSSASTIGALSATDWNTFNNKQSTLTLGNLTDAGTDGIVVTGGSGAVVGSGTSIAQHVADTTHNGYLASTDWNTFNGKQPAGSYLTAVSIANANGFTGTSSGGTTPLLTLTTTVNGILKGNGSGAVSATAGTDYSLGTSALTTGILKSTTTTGALTIAIASDFPTLNQNTTGSAASFTGSLVGDVTGTQGATTLTATTNSTLATLSGLTSATSLASVGTITTGVWNAGAVTSSSTIKASQAAAGSSVSLVSNNTSNAASTLSQVICQNDASSSLVMAFTSSNATQSGPALTNGPTTAQGQLYTNNSTPLVLGTNAHAAIIMDTSQGITMQSLSGTGSRAVTASAAGLLSAAVSDSRLKKNVLPLSQVMDPIETIKKLNGVAFNWDTSRLRVRDYGKQQELGFIAQDVEKIVPQVVRDNRDGYKSMDYDKLVPLLLESIKVLELRIKALESK